MISEEEAKGLVAKWVLFAKSQWGKWQDLAKKNCVALPLARKEVSGVAVCLSDRGVEFTYTNGYIQLEKLISEPNFKLKDLAEIRSFVELTIDSAQRDIESAVSERQQAFNEIFEGFRAGAAQWSLEDNKRQQKKF